jgi:hypothetical protein
MIVTDKETYHTLGVYDTVNLKCDTCFTIYQKTKRAWYYTAQKRGIGLDFGTKTYCSDKCRSKRYGVTRKQYNCLECNKEFNGLIKENPKFCGHSCAAIFNNKKRDGNKLVNCHVCSIEFSVWKSRDQKLFRCDSCIEQNNKILKEKKLKLPEIKIPKINTLICKFCSNIFEHKMKNALYCSSKCKHNNKKKYQHVCVGCNISFISTEKYSKYCSNSCRSINLKLSTYAHKAGGRSRSQIELFIEENLVKDFPNIKFLFNDKDTIGSELDVYIPELKMAIEINGIVHYEPIYGQEKLIRTQNRDKQKMINCYNLGIELIVIPLGKKGLSKKQTEEIYQEISEIINSNQNRKTV